MKIPLVLLAVSLLTGCAGWQTFKTGAAIEGARAADETLQVAEWGVCEAVTMGAWQRRYGKDPEKAAGWARLCSRHLSNPVIAAPDSVKQ